MVLVAGKMYRPTDIVAAISTQNLYVVEQFNHRVSKWDWNSGTFDFSLDNTWGSNGDGTSGEGAPIGDGGPDDNALYRPTGITFDNNRLIVTDTFHNRIRTINHLTGDFINSVGQGGSGVGDFYRPTGIDTNNAFLVIADEFNHRAVRYDVGNIPANPAVLPDPTPLAFHSPHGVIFDATDSFFNVTDSVRSIINRYDINADMFLNQFGTPGTTGTDLFFPGSGSGVLTDEASTTFADTRNNALKTVVDIHNMSTLYPRYLFNK